MEQGDRVAVMHAIADGLVQKRSEEMTETEQELSKKLLNAQAQQAEMMQYLGRTAGIMLAMARRITKLEAVVEGMCVGKAEGRGA